MSNSSKNKSILASRKFKQSLVIVSLTIIFVLFQNFDYSSDLEIVGYGSDFKYKIINAATVIPGTNVDTYKKEGRQIYAYAADILKVNPLEPQKLSLTYCSHAGYEPYIDVLRFFESTNNGLSWQEVKKLKSGTNNVYESKVLKPNMAGERSVCDPSRIKIGEYYYLYYSGLPLNVGSQIYLARSKDSSGPWEKYTGNNLWSADESAIPFPLIKSQKEIPACGGGAIYDSPSDPQCGNYSRYYGAGQQSAVLYNNEVYMFYVDDTQNFPTDANFFPERNLYLRKSTDGIHFGPAQKLVINNTNKSLALHSPFIGFNYEYKRFMAFSVGPESIITNQGHSDKLANNSLVVTYSVDGVNWTPLKTAVKENNLPKFAHNIGLSHDTKGQIGGTTIISMGAPFNPNTTTGEGTWGYWDLYMDFAQTKMNIPIEKEPDQKLPKCAEGITFEFSIQPKSGIEKPGAHESAQFCSITTQVATVGDNLIFTGQNQASFKAQCVQSGNDVYWAFMNEAGCGKFKIQSVNQDDYYISLNGQDSKNLSYKISGKTPVWRSSKNFDHLYSLHRSEGPGAGYSDEGLAYSAITLQNNNGTDSVDGEVPQGFLRMIRCASPITGKHSARPQKCLEGEITEGSLGYVFSDYSTAQKYSQGQNLKTIYSCDYPLENNQFKNFISQAEVECANGFINKRIVGYSF